MISVGPLCPIILSVMVYLGGREIRYTHIEVILSFSGKVSTPFSSVKIPPQGTVIQEDNTASYSSGYSYFR